VLASADLAARRAARQAPIATVSLGCAMIAVIAVGTHGLIDNIDPRAEIPVMADDLRTVSFDALFDDEAGVWVATSGDHITTEALSRDALLERLKRIVPDVLEARVGKPARAVKILVNWQELRTVDRTELMVA
jgi:hypothetical protein